MVFTSASHTITTVGRNLLKAVSTGNWPIMKSSQRNLMPLNEKSKSSTRKAVTISSERIPLPKVFLWDGSRLYPSFIQIVFLIYFFKVLPQFLMKVSQHQYLV